MPEPVVGRERQFDGTVFLAFAKKLFMTFLQARNQADLTPMHPHFSPGLYKAWRDFKPAQSERRRTTRPVNFEIQQAELTNHYQVQGMEVAVVVFGALAFPVDSRRQVLPHPVKERWTFIRPVEMLGQTCPSCGVPWTLTAWGKCRYCNKDFSGTSDGWTVANTENLSTTRGLFQDENAFLDYWDDTLRAISVDKGRPL